jgi:UDP-N-acetylmuramoylalanine-D-glutamate ligase
VHDGHIWLRNGKDQVVCRVDEIRLRGPHNVANVLAARLSWPIRRVFHLEAIRKAITTFGGVEHRLELVATVNGVQYINDSIATAPERVTGRAELVYHEPLILLAGGRDKDMVWDEWANQVQQAGVRRWCCLGSWRKCWQKSRFSAQPRAVSEAQPSPCQRPTASRLTAQLCGWRR